MIFNNSTTQQPKPYEPCATTRRDNNVVCNKIKKIGNKQ